MYLLKFFDCWADRTIVVGYFVEKAKQKRMLYVVYVKI